MAEREPGGRVSGLPGERGGHSSAIPIAQQTALGQRNKNLMETTSH